MFVSDLKCVWNSKPQQFDGRTQKWKRAASIVEYLNSDVNSVVLTSVHYNAALAGNKLLVSTELWSYIHVSCKNIILFVQLQLY